MCINWDTKFGLPLEYDDLQFFFLVDIEHNPCIDNLTLNYFDSNNYNLKSSYGLLQHSWLELPSSLIVSGLTKNEESETTKGEEQSPHPGLLAQ